MTAEQVDIKVVHRTTATINTPKISVGELVKLLGGQPATAEVSFQTIEGGDQRDRFPVGLRIVIEEAS